MIIFKHDDKKKKRIPYIVTKNMINSYGIVNSLKDDIDSIIDELKYKYKQQGNYMNADEKDDLKKNIIALEIVKEKMLDFESMLLKYKYDDKKYHLIDDVAGIMQDSCIGNFYADNYHCFYDLISDFYNDNADNFDDDDFDYYSNNTIAKIKELNK